VRYLLLALIASTAQANLYDFALQGTYYPDYVLGTFPIETGSAYVPFTVTFLANSPVLPFPTSGEYFSASVNAYDVDVIIGGEIIEQGGTGAFAFNGVQFGPYPNGDWIGGGWSFDTQAFSFGGTEDFALGNPDPLSGAHYNDEPGETLCYSGALYLCDVGGASVDPPATVPEPPVWVLSLAGLAAFGRRFRYASS